MRPSACRFALRVFATDWPKGGFTDSQERAVRLSSAPGGSLRSVMTPQPAEKATNDYTARHLSVLEGLEAVRKRPGMYIGSTDSRGLMQCVWEIIDNAVDEALAGVCTRIEVILHDDDSVEVHDNGRGIPVDIEPKTGL